MTNAQPTQERTEEIFEIEQLRVQRTLTALMNAADRRDFAKLRQHFAEEVRLETHPGRATHLPADDLLRESQRSGAGAGGRTHPTLHQFANREIRIEGDVARTVSFGHAFHRADSAGGADLWLLYCRYEHELRRGPGGWKITGIRVTPVRPEPRKSVKARPATRTKRGTR